MWQRGPFPDISFNLSSRLFLCHCLKIDGISPCGCPAAGIFLKPEGGSYPYFGAVLQYWALNWRGRIGHSLLFYLYIRDLDEYKKVAEWPVISHITLSVWYLLLNRTDSGAHSFGLLLSLSFLCLVALCVLSIVRNRQDYYVQLSSMVTMERFDMILFGSAGTVCCYFRLQLSSIYFHASNF